MINDILIAVAISSAIAIAINVGIIFVYMNNGKHRIGGNHVK